MLHGHFRLGHAFISPRSASFDGTAEGEFGAETIAKALKDRMNRMHRIE